jgi:hypothetical protein
MVLRRGQSWPLVRFPTLAYKNPNERVRQALPRWNGRKMSRVATINEAQQRAKQEREKSRVMCAFRLALDLSAVVWARAGRRSSFCELVTRRASPDRDSLFSGRTDGRLHHLRLQRFATSLFATFGKTTLENKTS